MAVLAVLFDNSSAKFYIQSIGAAQITSGAITGAQLASGAISSYHIFDGAIISGKLGSGLPLSRFLMDIQSFTNLLENGDFEVGDPPTRWTPEYSAILSRETTPTPKTGSYILKILSQSIYGMASQDVADFARYKGRKVTLGAWCYALSTNNRTQQIYIWDGIGASYSAVIPKDDAWHWVTVTRDIDGSANRLTPTLAVNLSNVSDVDDTLYIDGAILVEGDVCPAFSPKPVDIQSVISGSIAPNIIATPHILNQGILSASIGAAIVGTPHLINAAITESKIASGQVGWSHIAAEAVGTVHIAPGAIISGKIAPNIIATPHILNQGILSASIGAAIVGTPHLINAAITSAKIASGGVGWPHIAAGAVLSGHVASGQVGNAHIYPGAIVSGKVASGGLPPLTSGYVWVGVGFPQEQRRDSIGYTQGARAYNDTPQVIADQTWSTLAFNSERWDTDTIHDPTTNNSRLTCKTAGKYVITFHGLFAGNATGIRLAKIQLNGVTGIGIAVSSKSADSTQSISIEATTIYDLAVDDYVEALVWQNRGGDLLIEASANFSPEFAMQRIG